MASLLVDFRMETFMRVKTQNYLLLLTGLVLGVLVSIGHGVFAERDASTASLPVEELRTFSDSSSISGVIPSAWMELPRGV